jgi:hypothetical protein
MRAGTRIRSRWALVVLAVLVVAGCAAPAESSPGATAEPASTSAPAPIASPLPPASIEASVEPQPSPSPAPTAVSLPDGLDGVAWVTGTGVLNASGEWESTLISMGRLGRPASASVSLPRADGYARTVAAGDYAVVLVQRGAASSIRVYRVADGVLVGESRPGGPVDPEHLAVDPARGVLYAGVGLAGGGLEIRRIALDGSASTTLFALDDRFTADGIPTDRYGLVVATDGRLVVAACADGECRVWRVAPGEAAGSPVRLPAGTPELCSVVGATDQWLVVYDEEMCTADTGDAPFPLRGISLASGQSFRITDVSQVMASRVMVEDGRAVVVASHRSQDWSTSDIEIYDVRTGAMRVLVTGLPNEPDGTLGWMGVSSQQLPSPWVLVEPWGIDPTGPSTLPARLLNVTTGRVIELPLGTAGWS